MNLEPWQWALAVIGALCVGLAKTGLAGLGLVAVALFAYVVPTKQSSGLVLPLLLVGDIVAVASYRRHADWAALRRLLPWTAAGVVLGFFAMGRLADRQAQILIGGIVCALVVLHAVRRHQQERATARAGAASTNTGSESSAARITPATPWATRSTGVMAGFTTLVANAAGPLMTLYLLGMRLPKLGFVGTGAVFFLVLNLFKVPFMVGLGSINPASLWFDLWLAPLVVAGALAGRWLLPHIPQRWFENLALLLSAAAGAKLIVG